jgi:chromosome segregation ATPase
LHDLKAKFDDYQHAQDESALSRNDEYQSHLHAAKHAQAQLESRHQANIYQLQRNYEETVEALTEMRETNKLLKKTIQAQKTTILEKEATLAHTIQELSDSERELLARADSEKKHLIKTYEQAAAELRDQCEAHRSDVEKLAKDLAESEKRLQKAHAAILEAKRGKAQLETEFKAFEQQADREKQLTQASAQLAIQTAESDCAARLNEQKAQWDKEKRRIIAYVADAFKQYFNPQEAMDERALKQVVCKARDELAALSATNAAVRRIVGAASHQRTDDAVAQACLGKA